jgi:hypothetical protein
MVNPKIEIGFAQCALNEFVPIRQIADAIEELMVREDKF